MLPNTILEVTEENTKHFKCVSISMFMQIMQMSLSDSNSLHLPYVLFTNQSSVRTSLKIANSYSIQITATLRKDITDIV